MEKRKLSQREHAPRANAPRANALSYAVPSKTDPDGMYTGIPARSGIFSAPQTATPDAAFPGGKTYCSADNVSRLIAMQSDPDAPTQDADDL